ncbi:DUF1460 domain-containing protein [Pseudomonas syringae pv. syringae]|uniref:DUF1460 domain-containing protein n=1 Tax=Pseudomonas syringae TaxID=317 RepID=UPI0023F6DBD1|nr:N-acetylmuramoyl-L-alanine amidase-like domain-containing protein [Pseudomonas syringae]MDF5890255.1 DUF1460 domain-containing protein [Pseudomonas syringae pv. syringae]
MNKISVFILSSVLLTGCGLSGAEIKNSTPNTRSETEKPAPANLNVYTLKKLNSILEAKASRHHLDKGQMIDLISEQFLGTSYHANMLQGTENIPEQLVIDFRGLDCFTYLDYVEALRKSTSVQAFVKSLTNTRYHDGDIKFLKRKHFFTDWAYSKADILADDITSQVSSSAVRVEKQLNEKFDGEIYLPGLPVIKRSITYIPSDFVDNKVVSHLQTGDYIGIYTKLPGLDVTHVGIFIMTDKGPFLRNASSRKENEKVVDSPFFEYVARTPGIVVFRAKD